jgi:chemotaxis-related protein WspB
MQVAVWNSLGQLYAVRTHHVLEVVPVVRVRRVSHAPRWVKGLMDYRGRLLPLLDLAVLLGGDEADSRMSSRILVFRSAIDSESDERGLALLVEHFMGVHRFEEAGSHSEHPGLEIQDGRYLGPVVQSEWGPVQLIEPGRILDEEQAKVLFGRSEASEDES